MKLPVSASCGSDGLQCVPPEEISRLFPASDSHVKAAGAAAALDERASRAWPQLRHVHEGIANVIGDRIFLPSRWQPSK